jgi:hypothetical protein
MSRKKIQKSGKIVNNYFRATAGSSELEELLKNIFSGDRLSTSMPWVDAAA